MDHNFLSSRKWNINRKCVTVPFSAVQLEEKKSVLTACGAGGWKQNLWRTGVIAAYYPTAWIVLNSYVTSGMTVCAISTITFAETEIIKLFAVYRIWTYAVSASEQGKEKGTRTEFSSSHASLWSVYARGKSWRVRQSEGKLVRTKATHILSISRTTCRVSATSIHFMRHENFLYFLFLFIHTYICHNCNL